jgi:hypothetical protein
MLCTDGAYPVSGLDRVRAHAVLILEQGRNLVASHADHCRDCELALGEGFAHVHAWLDEFQAEYGPGHRPFRHHAEGVARVRALWGDAAAQAAEVHIRRDTGGILPTCHEWRTRWGISPDEIEPEPD